MKFCPNCGSKLKENVDVCLNCGKYVNGNNKKNSINGYAIVGGLVSIVGFLTMLIMCLQFVLVCFTSDYILYKSFYIRYTIGLIIYILVGFVFVTLGKKRALEINKGLKLCSVCRILDYVSMSIGIIFIIINCIL